ncbi:MAG TPA: hypothetical protein VD884_12915, partial [Ohtaekwangia sp.]|nr:hypothetical protein [Ohtaekwangia sp.]
MSDENKTADSGQETSLPKKAAKKKAKKKAAKKGKVTKAAKAIRNYPSITLDKCLIIAQKIKELNGGNPWAPREVYPVQLRLVTLANFFTIARLQEILGSP